MKKLTQRQQIHAAVLKRLERYFQVDINYVPGAVSFVDVVLTFSKESPICPQYDAYQVAVRVETKPINKLKYVDHIAGGMADAIVKSLLLKRRLPKKHRSTIS